MGSLDASLGLAVLSHLLHPLLQLLLDILQCISYHVHEAGTQEDPSCKAANEVQDASVSSYGARWVEG